MNQIIDYLTSLDWASNWALYILTATLIVWFAVLTIKLIIAKLVYLIKKTFFIGVLSIIAFVILYLAFLMGFISFDILTFIGFGEISTSIKEFLTNFQEWFINTFSLLTININLLK